MGIEPDIQLANFCPVCFPLNASPKFTRISLAGIQLGALWLPFMPPAPNGTWKLTNVGGCLWSGGDMTYVFNWKPNLPQTLILATVFLLAIAFSYVDINSCVTAGDNQILEPPNQIYYGGSAKIGWQA